MEYSQNGGTEVDRAPHRSLGSNLEGEMAEWILWLVIHGYSLPEVSSTKDSYHWRCNPF
jgi:hypothetical protein